MLTPIKTSVETLKNPNSTIEQKYAAIYELRSWKSEESLEALKETYNFLGKSELLEHEVVYIFGQQISEKSLDFLFRVLHDSKEAPVVRHEAGEALGNFVDFKDRVLPELRKHWDSEVEVLRSTVRLAIRKLENFSGASNNFNKYSPGTVEPAEPFSEEQFAAYLASHGKTTAQTLDLLIDPSIEEYEKYRVMYSLRERADRPSCVILAKLLGNDLRSKSSVLMRHEICFIFGQLSHKIINYPEVRALIVESAENPEEDPIVRHEAILAYSEIWGNDEMMERLKKDPAPLVYESARVVMNE